MRINFKKIIAYIIASVFLVIIISFGITILNIFYNPLRVDDVINEKDKLFFENKIECKSERKFKIDNKYYSYNALLGERLIFYVLSNVDIDIEKNNWNKNLDIIGGGDSYLNLLSNISRVSKVDWIPEYFFDYNDNIFIKVSSIEFNNDNIKKIELCIYKMNKNSLLYIMLIV